MSDCAEATGAPDTIARRIYKQGYGGRRIVLDGDGALVEQECSRCRVMQPVSAFNKHNGFNYGIEVECKTCRANRMAIRYRANRYGLLLKTVKTRAARNNLQFDLKAADLQEIFDRQGGRCVYSGIPFGDVSYETGLSIDRIDSSLGYTRDNIALACFWVNVMKSNCPVTEFVARLRLLVERVDIFTADPAIAPHMNNSDRGSRSYAPVKWFHEFANDEEVAI